MDACKSHRRIAQIVAGLFVLAGVLSGALRTSPPVYDSEEDAVAAGRELDIGTATLEGPQTVEVLSHQTWTLVYTAGRAGVRRGGAIRVALRHLHEWSAPQTDRPKDPGYLTVRAARDIPKQVAIQQSNLFPQYFPWQHIVEVSLPDVGLPPGETIRVTYGDQSGGSPGMRVQPFDEASFVFKCFVDAAGNSDFLPLDTHPSVKIVAAEPSRLSVVLPSDAVTGEPTWCIVRAEDRYGNPASSYRGTVRFASNDPSARLPEEYTFTSDDRGVRRFSGILFRRTGSHHLRVSDGAFRANGNPVRARPTRPERLLLWGDLHGHTLYSDGRGTVEEYYEFGERVAGLDFCAVTDHAFEVLDEMWHHSKIVTNRCYTPGKFVTFQAFEWSGKSNVGGDHNVYFLDEDPPIYRSDSYYDRRNFQMYHGPEPKVPHITEVFAKLEARLRDKNVFCIPHYGGRKGNPQWHSPEVQRMIEIFSEHRRSEDWATTFLEKGYRMGIIASTDNHFGNPGYGYLKPTYEWDQQEVGMAAVAVYASERTREAVFQALYDRHVYATSGERIVLDVRADGHAMGSEYRTAIPPTLHIEAVGTARITLVELKKNSETVYTADPNDPVVQLEWTDPDFRADRESYYYVRIVQTDDEEAITSPIWVN